MAELPPGWTGHMAQRPETVNVGVSAPDDAEDYLASLTDAIDLASDQDQMVWLVDEGKRVAAIVTTEEGEEAEQRRYRPLTPAAPTPLDTIRGQARRYLEARYGEDVWYRAPETFDNAVERWIWAVASSVESQTGEEAMSSIEGHYRSLRET